MLEIGTRVHDIDKSRIKGTIVGTCEYEGEQGYVVELDPKLQGFTESRVYVRLIVVHKDSAIVVDEGQ